MSFGHGEGDRHQRTTTSQKRFLISHTILIRSQIIGGRLHVEWHLQRVEVAEGLHGTKLVLVAHLHGRRAGHTAHGGEGGGTDDRSEDGNETEPTDGGQQNFGQYMSETWHVKIRITSNMHLRTKKSSRASC